VFLNFSPSLKNLHVLIIGRLYEIQILPPAIAVLKFPAHGISILFFFEFFSLYSRKDQRPITRIGNTVKAAGKIDGFRKISQCVGVRFCIPTNIKNKPAMRWQSQSKTRMNMKNSTRTKRSHFPLLASQDWIGSKVKTQLAPKHP